MASVRLIVTRTLCRFALQAKGGVDSGLLRTLRSAQPERPTRSRPPTEPAMTTMTMIFAVLAFVSVLGLQAAVSKLAKRQSRIEGKIDLLTEKLGVEYDPYGNVDPAVMELVRAGQKIQAIRLYREISGCDLEDAKEYVDEVEVGLRPNAPA